ncbi:MAG: copper-binding protein [Solirubrobacterales bacterium]|nr:copper-binding protein [Solirubrobacterales bacterium]
MRALLAISASLVLFAAGCGSSSDSTSSSASSPDTTSTPATPSGGVSASAVDIKGFAFNPAATTVKVGQKVTWTNEDSTTHNVVADDGSFKSGDLGQGAKFSFTPKKAGTFSYVCTFHSNMKATLTVQ